MLQLIDERSDYSEYGKEDDCRNANCRKLSILDNRSDLWRRQATQWSRLGVPLRPERRDLARTESIIRRWAERHGAPRALILGVTPDLRWIDWPHGTDLLAVDRNLTMVQQVWPGYPEVGQGAVCGDWLRLPLASGSRNFTIGDNACNMFSFPDRCRELLQSVRRVLLPGGLFLVRNFVCLDVPEDPGAVLRDLRAGCINNFHTFKIRLAMALQRNSAVGIRLGNVWDYWHTHGPDPAVLAAQLHWPQEDIATIDAYRGQDVTYFFPTFCELRALHAEVFDNVESWFPPYAFGERCPTFMCVKSAEWTETPACNGEGT